jgi:hypothetical protein
LNSNSPLHQPLDVRNRVFGTSPIVFHHPGRTGKRNRNRIEGIIELKRDLFDLIGDRRNGRYLDRKEKRRLSIPTPAAVDEELGSKLTVVFVSNLSEPGSGPRSLDYFGTPYRIIGADIEKWDFEKRLLYVDRLLPEVKTEYMMVMDSDDVFTVAALDIALERFRRDFDCQLLFNAGQNFWPPELDESTSVRAFCDRTPSDNGPEHRYVNGGMWIGRTDFYRRISKEILNTSSPRPGDDQSIFYLMYQKYHPEIQLDYRCQIFQCEFDEELEWEVPTSNRWLRKMSRSWPPAIQRATGMLRRKRGRPGYDLSTKATR